MSNFHHDQAAGLRRIMAAPKPRVVSIISAATTQDQPRMMTNLAASIFGQGSNVLVVHASQDSREVKYGVDKSPSLFDVIIEMNSEVLSLSDAISSTSYGFNVGKLMQKNQFNLAMDSDECELTNQLLGELAHQYEIVLVDATLNKDQLLPLKILNNGEIIIQLTRQPESITNAYALIKQICSQLGRRSFGIIVDNATDAQAQIVFRNISQVARRFMQIELEFFGSIPCDDHLSRAAKLGRSVIDAFPLASASTAFKQIAQRLDYKQDSIAINHMASIN